MTTTTTSSGAAAPLAMMLAADTSADQAAAPQASPLTTDDRRQQSVVLYRLTDGERCSDLRAQLEVLVGLARDLTGAQSAAVTMLDGDWQVVLAASAGVAADRRPHQDGICSRALSHATSDEVFLTPDARLDARVRDSPAVCDATPGVRFYAGAPLTGQEGAALGMLCVWSTDVHTLTADQVRLLGALRKAVLHVLDERRRARSRQPLAAIVASHQNTPQSPTEPARLPSGPSIGELIDRREVRTLFQPVVHLPSGEVVGFEAFTRGPAGTVLEAPSDLLAAAMQAGRLGELDWVCRTAALKCAMDSALHPSTSWFINVEPAGLETTCPEDLADLHARARGELRVVLELTERSAHGDVTKLLRAADQARLSTWGVAVDNVGSEAMSLALLPLLQPDVVKVDMRALARLPASSIAVITAAVRAYAERSSAVILAIGIETAEDKRLALVYGATYGQGYLLGHPQALPASQPTPRSPVPLRQKAPPLSSATPFSVISAHTGSRRAAKRDLMHISEHLERQGETAVEAGVLLSSFQRAAFFTDLRRARYHQLAAINAYTVAAAQGLSEHTTPRLRLTPLAAGNRMADEWAVIFLGPQSAAALVAHDCGDTGPDTDRQYDFIYTHDRALVVLAARSFLVQCGDPTTASTLSTDRELAAPGCAEDNTPSVNSASRPQRWRRR